MQFRVGEEGAKEDTRPILKPEKKITVSGYTGEKYVESCLPRGLQTSYRRNLRESPMKPDLNR